MKWMIASDLHGDADCTAALLAQYKSSGAERLILLGDLLYHGPRNDLPAAYAPKRVIELLNGLKNELICVRGNCDTEVDQMVLTFPVLQDSALLFDGNRTYLAQHGHHAVPPLREGDILLGGHTHVPVFEHRTTENGVRYLHINPGSVSLPKENSPKSFICVENGIVTFHTLDGEVYRREVIG
jgi:putative phosphoesterase